MKMSNKLYDILKPLSAFLAPLITFIILVVNTMEVPHADKIATILAGINTLIGAWVIVSSKLYNGETDGENNESLDN